MRKSSALLKNDKILNAFQDDRKKQTEKHVQLVKYIAYRLAMHLPSHINVNDLISAGTVGLLEAIDRFDPSRGVKLETFAYTRIRGAMLDELRSMDWVSPSMRQKTRRLQEVCYSLEVKLGRPPTEEEIAQGLCLSVKELQSLLYQVQGMAFISLEDLGVSKGEVKKNHFDCLQDTHEEDPEGTMGFKEIRKILTHAIQVLPEKERFVLSLYYYNELTLKEIGKVLGLTESRICQLHSQAILKLKGKMKVLVSR